MKQQITTGMLLIAALLLGAFIVFFERETETSHQQMARSRTIFEVLPDSINWIQMERNGIEIECSKASGTWRLTLPADVAVDVAVVERMIAGMAAVQRGELIRKQTLIERGLTPADYGFDEPRARISFRNNNGEFTWRIGRSAPLGDMLYVMSDQSGDIISAPETLLNLIPEDSAWIRDRTLFRTPATAIRGVDLRRPSGFLQLRQIDNNEWVMQQPHEDRADSRQVHALIEKLLDVYIANFVTDEKVDPTVYGLENPEFELSLFTQSGQTQTLQIGKLSADNPETRFAKWIESDSVFTIPEEWIKHLEIDSTSLRNRKIIYTSTDQITGLNISRGNQQVGLVQTNGQWEINRPALWEAEPSQVRALLGSLSQGVIEEFIDTPNKTQLTQIETAPWTLEFSTDESKHTLKVSRPDEDGRVLIQRDTESSLYATSATLLRNSFSDPLFYRNRTVLEISPLEIERVTLRSRGQEQQVINKKGKFMPSDPSQKMNSDAVFDLAATLSGLRAERYVEFNPESLSPYGLDNPEARLNISLNSTNSLGQVLLLGNTTTEGRFAMIQGHPTVFVLPNETARVLTQNLIQPIEKKAEEIETP